jgi:DNA-binding CsgD family transcriptional regulator
VGKTRFVTEGMRRAQASGEMVSVWGGCLPLVETLPLLAIADALGELSRLDGGELVEAALAATPSYVGVEVERLVPQIGTGDAVTTRRADSGQRERLFAAVAELLGAVAQRCPVVLVVEDVHWADSATLDCLTFLARARGADAPVVVVICRSDEAPVEQHVTEWLTHMRGSGGVTEIKLKPLSRDELAEQIAGLAGGAPAAPLVEELYARAEGNPFFTEQLLAAAEASSTTGELPARLAELLVGRVRRCGGEARTVLDALAVAGRPLGEDALGAVSGLDVQAVHRALRELATARLLGDASPGEEQRPRHALLAEAVAAELLAGELLVLHERTARALEATGDEALAAEVAGHWAAAKRTAEELPVRVRAAQAAERVFGYDDAARHWQRAIALFPGLPNAEQLIGIDLPSLYLRAIRALEASGEGERAGMLAEEAYAAFADHPDPATAAIINLRAAVFRSIGSPAAGLPLIEEALRLFEQAPTSAEHAEAWYSYAIHFLFHGQGRLDAGVAALDRALEIAEASGASALIPLIHMFQASFAFDQGQIERGFAALQRGRALAEASGDGAALIRLAINESDALVKAGWFDRAADVALRGLHVARRTGRETSFDANLAASNAAEALLAQGRTGDAAVVIDPLTSGLPDRDHHLVYAMRVEIDMLRGHLDTAARRLLQLSTLAGHLGSIDIAREVAQLAAELALWARRPENALSEVRRVLALYPTQELTIFCGRLLVVGMRACADLAERARAGRDEPATYATAAAAEMTSWVDQMAGAPFADHPWLATIPAERASWEAERSRLAGASDPTAWHAAAKAWDDLGCPHRAGYAWWRHAEARLLAGHPPTAAAAGLRAAKTAGHGHEPLLAVIRALANRAHIALDSRSVAAQEAPHSPDAAPYGLTSREILVLRLLVAGYSNGQIGTELFISRKTASVHVSNILRKLGVSTRVQAAALAERAGLLHTS